MHEPVAPTIAPIRAPDALSDDGASESPVAARRRVDWLLLQVVLLTFAFYLAILPVVLKRLDPLTGDEPFYVMTAISLLHDHDLDEANNYAQRDYDEFYPAQPLPADFQGWPAFPTTLPPHPAHSRLPGLHTKHGIGLSLLIALPYAALGRAGADLLVMVMAALLAGQMFLLAREVGAGDSLAAMLAVALALAMPIGPYALLIFPEVPAGLLLVYAVRRIAAPLNTRLQWLATGAAVGFLPWLHQRFAFTAAVLAAWVLWRVLRARALDTALFALAPIAVGGLSLLAYNEWIYGIPFQRVEDHAGFNGVSGTLNGAMGLLLDAQWGLLVAAPLMIAALAALPWWYRAAPRSFAVAVSVLAPYLLVVAAYKVWWGEWGPPARYLVPVVPFAAASLGAWLPRASWGGRITAGLLWLSGMLLTIVGYINPQRFYHQPDGINHLWTIAGEHLHFDFASSLVAFQAYALAPLRDRVWVSLLTLLILGFAAMLITIPLVGERERGKR